MYCFTRRRSLLVFLISVFCSSQIAFLSAGEFNPTLSIGDVAPTWKELWGTDDKKHSSDEFKDKQALVIVFTCNTCPTALDYEDRLIALAKRFAADPRCALVAINPNKVVDDLPPKMAERAKLKGFNFQYLHDESQQVAKAFGATYTPEFFVLNKERKVIYMGAMDDNTDPTMVKIRFVEDAVTAAFDGKPAPKAETVARGCTVRYARERRKN